MLHLLISVSRGGGLVRGSGEERGRLVGGCDSHATDAIADEAMDE